MPVCVGCPSIVSHLFLIVQGGLGHPSAHEARMLNSSQLHQYYSDLEALTHLAPMLSEATASMFPGGSRYSPHLWTTFFAKNYDQLSAIAPGLLVAAKQLAADGKAAMNDTQTFTLLKSGIQYVSQQQGPEVAKEHSSYQKPAMAAKVGAVHQLHDLQLNEFRT
jgi:hypothetical protein